MISFRSASSLDLPRMLREKENVAARRLELRDPHIVKLTNFSRSLRRRDLGHIPDFDPWDGGVNAKALFLYEKPGPKAFASGFISRNNDDPTAEISFKFLQLAGLERRDVVAWNVIPGWNGTMKVTSTELLKGLQCLEELTELLVRLKVIILVGQNAARAKKLLEATLPKVAILQSYHPSPKVRACAPEKWKAIPTVWAQAKRYL